MGGLSFQWGIPCRSVTRGLPRGCSLSCQPLPWRQGEGEPAFFCHQNWGSAEVAWGPRCWLDPWAAPGRRWIKDILGTGLWGPECTHVPLATGKKSALQRFRARSCRPACRGMLSIAGGILKLGCPASGLSSWGWHSSCPPSLIPTRLLQAAWVAGASSDAGLWFGADPHQR